MSVYYDPMTNTNNRSNSTKLEIFQNETLPRAEETLQVLAKEARQFVKKHPVACVAGALLVGYVIGAAIAKNQSNKGRKV